MKTDKSSLYFIIGTVVFTVVLMVGGIFLLGGDSSSNMTENQDALIEILDPVTHDWGEIDINGGLVEKTFTIKNSGKGDLELTKFVTSCMCTEVEVIIDGESSPMFGMHTKSNWIGKVGQGKEAEIRVVFDPLFHGPTATGPITRTVKFNTNDTSNSVVEFRLSGTVI